MNLSNAATHHLGAQLKSRSSALVTIESSIYACLILITLSGNVLALLILYRTPRSVTNLLISSLAISDILMPVLCCFQSLWVLIVGHWPFGKFICQLQAFGVLALVCASLQVMALAAVNRYFCIVRPFDYRRIFTVRRTKLMIAAVWALASTEPLPYLISGKRYVFHPGKFFCFQGKKIYFQSLLIYGYVGLSMGTIILCYFNVFLTLRKHQRTVANRLRHTETSSPTTSVEEIKATKTLFLTVIGFVAVWTPILVVDVIDFGNGDWILPRQVYVMYTYLGVLSSAVNPFIYGVMNRRFRLELRKLFKLGRKRHVLQPRVHRVQPFVGIEPREHTASVIQLMIL